MLLKINFLTFKLLSIQSQEKFTYKNLHFSCSWYMLHYELNFRYFVATLFFASFVTQSDIWSRSRCRVFPFSLLAFCWFRVSVLCWVCYCLVYFEFQAGLNMAKNGNNGETPSNAVCNRTVNSLRQLKVLKYTIFEVFQMKSKLAIQNWLCMRSVKLNENQLV